MTAPLLVVASYRRAEALRDKTLAYLAQTDWPPERVQVWVTGLEEEALYRLTLKPGSYGAIRVGAPGLAAGRNRIFASYPAGTPLLCLDDDVEALVGPDLRPIAALQAFAAQGFARARQHRLSLWGPMAAPIPEAMRAGAYRTGTLHIPGSCFGVVNRPELGVTWDCAESLERSLRFAAAEGAVLRARDAAVRTRYFQGAGGLVESRTLDGFLAHHRALDAAFPGKLSWDGAGLHGYPGVSLKGDTP